MNFLTIFVLTLAGLGALSGISLIAYAMLPTALIIGADHGRYAGLGGHDRR